MTNGNPRGLVIDETPVTQGKRFDAPDRKLTDEEIDLALAALFNQPDRPTEGGDMEEIEPPETEQAEKGGAGSGHRGHAGRPGEHGGSLPGTGAEWAHHGGGRDPIGYMGSGAYARGVLARGGREHARRKKEYQQNAKHLVGEFSAVMDRRFQLQEEMSKPGISPERKAELEALDDAEKPVGQAWADKIDANIETWMTYNDGYLEQKRAVLWVNGGADQIGLDTRGLRKGLDPVREGHRAFQRMIPAHVAGEAATVEVRRPTAYGENRAYYQRGAIYMPTRTSARTTMHELGHYLEDKNPTVHTRALAFLEKRTKGEPAQKLSDVSGRVGYKDHEITKKDKFTEPYMGKQYSGGYATEIISMGLEEMYADPAAFARADPEYFDFIWSTVRGLE